MLRRPAAPERPRAEVPVAAGPRLWQPLSHSANRGRKVHPASPGLRLQGGYTDAPPRRGPPPEGVRRRRWHSDPESRVHPPGGSGCWPRSSPGRGGCSGPCRRYSRSGWPQRARERKSANFALANNSTGSESREKRAPGEPRRSQQDKIRQRVLTIASPAGTFTRCPNTFGCRRSGSVLTDWPAHWRQSGRARPQIFTAGPTFPIAPRDLVAQGKPRPVHCTRRNRTGERRVDEY